MVLKIRNNYMLIFFNVFVIFHLVYTTKTNVMNEEFPQRVVSSTDEATEPQVNAQITSNPQQQIHSDNKQCDVNICIDRCTNSTAYCDLQTNMCICKGHTDDINFETCKEIGKIWKENCFRSKPGEVKTDFSEAVATMSAAFGCNEKCLNKVNSLINFCYKAKSYICDTQQSIEPKCFCYVYRYDY